MKLKYKTERVVNCFDLDKLVQEVYGRPYCFQQQGDCKPRGTDHFTVPVGQPWDYKRDSIPEVVNGSEMGVSFKAWLERDPNQKLDTEDEWGKEHGLELFWERNFYPSLDMVIQDLYEKGHIEEGGYTIVIDW